MATAKKPAGEGEESEGTFVTRDDLDEFKRELMEAIGSAPRGGGGKSKPAGDDGHRTARQEESEAKETVEQAFERLERQKAHDKHHERLAQREKEAEERREKAGTKAPPVERRGLVSSIWDY